MLMSGLFIMRFGLLVMVGFLYCHGRLPLNSSP
jgi:hypothetical protein